MRRALAAILGVTLMASGGVALAGDGFNGGTSQGAASWQSGGGVLRDLGTMLVDPTGVSGIDYRVSGFVYGATRGPGAEEIQPDRAPTGFPKPVHGGANPKLGHVPTDQQLAKGAQPSMVLLGPIPRPGVSEP